MDKSSWLCTRMIVMLYRSCTDQENDEQLELVLKYHILVHTSTLMYFVNYIYHDILFLSIFVNTGIRTKSSIRFVSWRNNVIKEAENVLYLGLWVSTYKKIVVYLPEELMQQSLWRMVIQTFIKFVRMII